VIGVRQGLLRARDHGSRCVPVQIEDHVETGLVDCADVASNGRLACGSAVARVDAVDAEPAVLI
jgi:hypothetical protein